MRRLLHVLLPRLCLDAIAAGGEITVSRQIHGVWVDVPLPSSPGDPMSGDPGR